ncbi:altronate dehydratase [Natronospirillum operosum]|uniref:Altronate dehydratase n=1 Tax=Natronospirillum operosum TaxID=2759953 RepID=A0A4Z0WDV4_9GAMM|nr:altronate dehydratase family protein [Natronospirillum operosum]TGG93412.1 altronate dehydratase [Natronospirillum operosum]
MNTWNFLKVHPDDDLIVALTDLRKGETVDLPDRSVTLTEDVQSKHKFAMKSFEPGERLTMYGVTIGVATKRIAAGAAISVDNVEHSSTTYAASDSRYEWSPPDVSAWRPRTLNAFIRPDGQVGTANYWLVVPLVFCQNRNVDVLRTSLQDALGYSTDSQYRQLAWQLADQYRNAGGDSVEERAETFPVNQKTFENVDGVKFLTHTSGCGGTREDAVALCRLLAAYIHHPNVAGATVLSLGCQNAQIPILEEALSDLDPERSKPVHYFEQQAYGSEQTLMEGAIKKTFEGLHYANQYSREPAPLSKLKIGVECGGSDGFSGLSANPLIGQVVDRVVALGGTGILGEFPELCGVEQELLDRCVSSHQRERFKDLMQSYVRHAAAVGASFDMNPSPGNIRDGLITDAMKSAGAARKGGTSPVVDVLDYPQVARKPGLNLLCTPGNDVESTTALAAAGANIILFSTGMGTPTGNPIVPVLKVSSNSDVARRMADIIDFDAGPVINGERQLPELAEELLQLCVDTGSGAYISKAQRLGQDDFIPWKRGVSL